MVLTAEQKKALGSLKDAKVFHEAISYLQRLMLEKNFENARFVLKVFPEWVGDSEFGLDAESEEREQMEQFLWLFRWIDFVGLETDQERFGLFQAHVRNALMIPNFSMWEALRYYLTTLWKPEERADAKRQVNDALLKNEELLTSQDLRASGTSSETRPPTIANWLKDYVAHMSQNQNPSLAREEYLFRSQNTTQLSEEERAGLSEIIVIYENCKLRSDDYPGYENDFTFHDEQGNLVEYHEGQLTKTTPAQLRQVEDELAQVRKFLQPTATASFAPSSRKLRLEQEFLGPAAEREEIRTEEERIHSQKIGLRDALWEAVTQKQPYRAQAILRIMARENNLIQIFSQDSRYVDFVKKEIANRYSEKAQLTFRDQISLPVHIALLLQSLFHDRLGLRSDQSARFGIQLIALQQKKFPDLEFSPMVYADLASGQFRWAKIVEQEGTLVFEEVAENP